MTGHSDPHLDLDTLADLQEGLLTSAGEVDAQAHLGGCAGCRAALDALSGVRVTLAGAAVTETLPLDVRQRLDLALTDLLDAPEVITPAASGPDSGAASTTVTALRTPQRSSSHGMRVLQAAAVVVLLLAGGAVAVSALSGRSADSGTTAADSAAGGAAPESAAPPGSFPLTASGRDWTAATLQADAAALARGELAPTIAPEARAGYTADRGDTSAAPGDPSTDPSAAPELFSEAPVARLAGGPALAACVAALADGPVTPVAVDLATFAGEPVAVILLPGSAGPDTVDVWVVGEGCTPGDDQTRYYANVARTAPTPTP